MLAHVGDSRAYLFQEKHLKRITEDHSYIGQMIKEGRITEAEAKKHPRRGEVQRALGIHSTVEVDAQELPYNGELVMLCTDGLTNMLTDMEIEAILHGSCHLQKTCEILIENTNKAGGADNVTVVLAKSD